ADRLHSFDQMHLARLAVLPDWQGRGVGRALLSGVVDHFDSAGTPMITVNTQHDNTASLKLYQLFGFENTGEHFPVWEFGLG
ncbi:MAG: GNAT family N-acetyltransferase, partial [Chloroflexota bacterium]